MINLKIARIKKGLSQQELAKMLNCSSINISRYETGKIKPPIDVLCKLADALETTTDNILGRE